MKLSKISWNRTPLVSHWHRHRFRPPNRFQFIPVILPKNKVEADDVSGSPCAPFIDNPPAVLPVFQYRDNWPGPSSPSYYLLGHLVAPWIEKLREISMPGMKRGFCTLRWHRISGVRRESVIPPELFSMFLWSDLILLRGKLRRSPNKWRNSVVLNRFL